MAVVLYLGLLTAACAVFIAGFPRAVDAASDAFDALPAFIPAFLGGKARDASHAHATPAWDPQHTRADFTFYVPSQATQCDVLVLRVAVSGPAARTVQASLERTCESANTSTPHGLKDMLQATSLALLRNKEGGALRCVAPARDESDPCSLLILLSLTLAPAVTLCEASSTPCGLSSSAAEAAFARSTAAERATLPDETLGNVLGRKFRSMVPIPDGSSGPPATVGAWL